MCTSPHIASHGVDETERRVTDIISFVDYRCCQRYYKKLSYRRNSARRPQ